MVATGDEAGLAAFPHDANDAHTLALTPVLALARSLATENGAASPSPILTLRLPLVKRTRRRHARDPAPRKETRREGHTLAQNPPSKKTTKKRPGSALLPLRPGSRKLMMMSQKELKRMIAHHGDHLAPDHLLLEITRVPLL